MINVMVALTLTARASNSALTMDGSCHHTSWLDCPQRSATNPKRGRLRNPAVTTNVKTESDHLKYHHFDVLRGRSSKLSEFQYNTT